MKITKQIARQIVFPSIIGLGIERIMSMFSEKKLLNIYYHGVVNSDSTFFNPRHIDVVQFEEHIKYFVKNFDVVSLNEAFEIKKNKSSLKRPTITISFDDGYKNNLDIALPILEKYNVKATFFISGVCVENDKNTLMWADIVDFAKYFSVDNEFSIDGVRFNNFIEVSTNKSIYDYIKALPKLNRDVFLSKLIDKFDIDSRKHELNSEIWEMMDSDEIIKASKSSVIDIQSHGYLHYNLGMIDYEDAIMDIKKSKLALDGIIKEPVSMICFPDGSYSKEVIDKILEIGFDKNVACDYLFDDDVSNPIIINRYGISNTTTFASNMFFINKSFINKGI